MRITAAVLVLFAAVTPAAAQPAVTTAWLQDHLNDPAVRVVVTGDEANAAKSFRNLERVVVTTPSELEIAAVVWARALLVSETALEAVQGRAS